MTSYLYNEEIGRLNENKVEKASTGFALQDTFYAFDNNGNVLQKTETVEQMVHEYNYDELNRLVTARLVQTNAEIYNHKYNYDEAGNILAKDVDSLSSPTLGNRGYQYAKPHAVSHFVGEYKTDLAASYDYQYDPNGNMTSEVISYTAGAALTRSKTMTWDADNLMRSVTADGTTTTMVYDHTGERTRKASSTGKVTDYIAGLAQVDSSGEVLYFVFDGINRVASIKKVGAVAQTFFMHTDQLGSTTLVTSGEGATLGDVTQKLDYKPFGEIFQQFVNGSWSIGFDPSIIALVGGMTFTGQEMDETGLYYYGARFYDPNSGRFISSDTVIDGVFDTQGYNRYSYVKNNPVNYSDPTGHSVDDPNDPPPADPDEIARQQALADLEAARLAAEEAKRALAKEKEELDRLKREAEINNDKEAVADLEARLYGLRNAIDNVGKRVEDLRSLQSFLNEVERQIMSGGNIPLMASMGAGEYTFTYAMGRGTPNFGVGNQQISGNGIAFITGNEGTRNYFDNLFHIYQDHLGNDTIGWGHLVKSGEFEKFKNGINSKMALDLFRNDIANAVSYVNSLQVILNQAQFDSLVDVAFKNGSFGPYLIGALKSGDYQFAGDLLLIYGGKPDPNNPGGNAIHDPNLKWPTNFRQDFAENKVEFFLKIPQETP